MPFNKGQSGNPNGRPTGTPNKVTQEIREKLNDFIDTNFDKFIADLQEIEPKERIKFYIQILEFGLPKLKTVDMSVTQENCIASIELSREEIRKISENLDKEF